MRTAAAILAVAAVQGVVASPQIPGEAGKPYDINNLDPPRAPTSEENLKLQNELLPKHLRLSACFQQSGGQYIKGNSGPLYVYPCISMLQIRSSCSAYGKSRQQTRDCYFGQKSTFSKDYSCCVACLNQNQQGDMGSYEDSPKLLKTFENLLNNGEEGPVNATEVFEQAKEEANIKPLDPPPPYCPEIETPQGHGVITGKVNKTELIPVAEKAEVEMPLKAPVSYETNGNQTMLANMKLFAKIQFCGTCAEHGETPEEIEASVRKSISISSGGMKIEKASVDPKSIVKKAPTAKSNNALSLKNFDLDNCIENINEIPQESRPKRSADAAHPKLQLSALVNVDVHASSPANGARPSGSESSSPGAQKGQKGGNEPQGQNGSNKPQGQSGSNEPQPSEDELPWCEE